MTVNTTLLVSKVTISAFLLHKGIKRSKWNTYEGRYFEAE